jgi:pimeloyl-ACP methyl ester carboxylesterase
VTIDADARTATLHGQDLCFLDVGSGPGVMLIHGLLGSHRSWDGVVGELSREHRVLAPDLFGHGGSAKPRGDYSLGAHAATLRDLLDRLGVERTSLVGHSLGGGIALQFCYLFPDRVDRLVLVSSGGLGRAVSPLLRSATLPGAELVIPALASTWLRERAETLGRALARIGWRPGSDLTQAWDGLGQLGEATSRRAFLATARSVIDPGGQTVTAHDHLPMETAVPTLVVWGTEDHTIPAWHAATALQAIPGSRLELFEGSGHHPHLDQPERFAQLLVDFVGQS